MYGGSTRAVRADPTISEPRRDVLSKMAAEVLHIISWKYEVSASKSPNSLQFKCPAHGSYSSIWTRGKCLV
jgi:hypothetical protein